MSRLKIGNFNGIDVLEGRCEGCETSTRILYDESVGRYVCASWLQAKNTPTEGHAFGTDPKQPLLITVDGHRKATRFFKPTP